VRNVTLVNYSLLDSHLEKLLGGGGRLGNGTLVDEPLETLWGERVGNGTIRYRPIEKCREGRVGKCSKILMLDKILIILNY